MSENPYEPHGGGNEELLAEQIPKTRWRIIPAAFLLLFGGVFFVGASIVFLLVVRQPRMPSSLYFQVATLFLFLGASWTCGGVLIWRKHFLPGVFVSVAGFVLTFVVGLTV